MDFATLSIFATESVLLQQPYYFAPCNVTSQNHCTDGYNFFFFFFFFLLLNECDLYCTRGKFL